MEKMLLYFFIMSTMIFLLQESWKISQKKKRQKVPTADIYLDISYIGSIKNKKKQGRLEKKVPIYKNYEYVIGTYLGCDIHLPRKFDLSCLGRFIADNSFIEFQLEEGMARVAGKENGYISPQQSITLHKGDILSLNSWMIRIVPNHFGER